MFLRLITMISGWDSYMFLLNMRPIIISLCKTTIAVFSMKSPSIIKDWLIMLKHMFFHISILYEALMTDFAYIRLDTIMDTYMVKEIPSS
mmetsp:Transcript_20886/g.18513  ORF Transcript_20886/g.18513 Transcript_20886/m.18513 type:complete len:90 (-) Transcript_20886:378-647(-)